jgi:glycosyltransferase involved in cell wall biosynthesis
LIASSSLSFLYWEEENYIMLFTVLTPAYNRPHTLGRVYESLKAQTFRDFEWLIVDDSTTDDVQKVVQPWLVEANTFVRYSKQKNSGTLPTTMG